MTERGIEVDEDFVCMAAYMLKEMSYYFQGERWRKIIPPLSEAKLLVQLNSELLDFWVEMAQKGYTFSKDHLSDDYDK